MGWLWFLGTLIPMTGLVSAGESVFIANRWTYLPHIGLLYPFIWMITNYYLKHPKLKIYTGILIICTIMGLSYSSWSQARYWKNSELFWQQAINTSKDNNFAHYMLGTYYLDNKYSEKALSQFEIAYQLDSTDPFTLFQIGNTYIQTGDIITGWKYYEMIITSNTPNIKILTNMGTLSLNNNRPELALKFFVTALKTPVERSHHIQSKLIALLYAGHTAYLLNRVEEATSYFKKFTESKLANKNELCEFAIDELLKINMQNNKIRSYELVTNLCMESLIR
jgi:protein O-mannosyl-transferase